MVRSDDEATLFRRGPPLEAVRPWFHRRMPGTLLEDARRRGFPRIRRFEDAQLGEKASFVLTDSGDFDTKTSLARVEQALLPLLKSWSLGFDEGMALAGP